MSEVGHVQRLYVLPYPDNAFVYNQNKTKSRQHSIRLCNDRYGFQLDWCRCRHHRRRLLHLHRLRRRRRRRMLREKRRASEKGNKQIKGARD